MNFDSQLQNIILRLFILFNNKRKGLSHADFFKVGIFSYIDNLQYLKSYTCPTDRLPILFEPSCMQYEHGLLKYFTEYDWHILLLQNKNNDNKIQLSILPINKFIHPREFNIDNSLKIAVITYNYITLPEQYFYFPEKIVNDKQLLHLEQCINILSK